MQDLTPIISRVCSVRPFGIADLEWDFALAGESIGRRVIAP